MTTIFDYLEWVTDGSSPNPIGFTTSTGQGTELLLLKNITTYAQLMACFSELIGTSYAWPGPTTGSGGSSFASMLRTLPVRHPYCPWYCVGVNSFTGYGQPYQAITNTPTPFNPIISKWCLYNNYRITSNFQPLPYPILSDDVIGNDVDGQWYNDNGTLQTFKYCKEYERFAFNTTTPSDDNVTAQQGYLAFNAINLPQNARTFLAQPRLYLNNQKMSIMWYNVPYFYITSQYSYLRRWRGRINQNAFNSKSLGSYGPGEMLYLGYSFKKFVQPFDNTTVVEPGSPIPDFLYHCDIELHFMITERTIQEVPLHEPQNLNWIASGFNLQPYLGDGSEPNSRSFLYASTQQTQDQYSRPQWDSFPVELLFANPNALAHI